VVLPAPAPEDCEADAAVDTREISDARRRAERMGFSSGGGATDDFLGRYARDQAPVVG
jgi:hypothetical protein